MTRLRPLLLAAALALPATPALAEDSARSSESVSAGLSPEQRTGYREIFYAIRANDWLAASARLAALPQGPLHDVARAELFLAKGSPQVEAPDLVSVLQRAPEMPKAEQIARLAQTRGASDLPRLPEAQKLAWVGSQPRRSRAEATKGDPAAGELEPLVQPLIKDNRPYEAEAVLTERQDRLGSQARTEYQQRIAWSYYIVGNDRDARRLAALARAGSGEWAIHGAWSEGLAAWRSGDCRGAADAFGHVAGRSTDVELAAAAHYWAGRAETLSGAIRNLKMGRVALASE